VEALHGRGPVAQGRYAGVRDIEVVVAEVELGVPGLGEHDLARAREPDLVPVQLQRDELALRHCASIWAVPEIEVRQADVTKLEVDAVANAANTELRHGGGVAAAIARAAGEELERESRERAPIGLGAAVGAAGGEMPSRVVVH